MTDHPEMAAFLIERGAQLEARDSFGRTPLLVAAIYRRLEAAEALIAKGSNLFAESVFCGNMATAIHAAANSGSIEIVGLLLKAGVDVNLRAGGRGETPLQTAADWGQLAMIAFLIERGADPNMRDNLGATPVQFVSQHPGERQEVITLLRSFGARD
jgi:ankyrin repeat protein